MGWLLSTAVRPGGHSTFCGQVTQVQLDGLLGQTCLATALNLVLGARDT